MMTEGEPETGNGETNLVLRQIATNHDRCNSEILVTALDRALEFTENACIFIEICSVNYRIQGHL